MKNTDNFVAWLQQGVPVTAPKILRRGANCGVWPRMSETGKDSQLVPIPQSEQLKNVHVCVPS